MKPSKIRGKKAKRTWTRLNRPDNFWLKNMPLIGRVRRTVYGAIAPIGVYMMNIRYKKKDDHKTFNVFGQLGNLQQDYDTQD